MFRMCKKDTDNFHTRGFQMTFENGVTASIVWGNGTYSDNHDTFLGRGTFNDTPRTVEVAAYDSNDNWVTREVWDDEELGDDVIGWLTADEVAKFISKCAEYTPKDEEA